MHVKACGSSILCNEIKKTILFVIEKITFIGRFNLWIVVWKTKKITKWNTWLCLDFHYDDKYHSTWATSE
jgi:hypothetical protein